GHCHGVKTSSCVALFWCNVSLVTRERLNRCAALILLDVSLAVSAHGQGRDLNHISDRAVQLVKQAVLLAEADKPLAAIRAVKTARLISPNYLRAHIEYQNIKTNYLDQYDEVERSEERRVGKE